MIFKENNFLNEDGSKIETPGAEIVEKFQQITDIVERRVADDKYLTSDIATFAAIDALKSANYDPEKLDYIIVAHNLGDIKAGGRYPDLLPTISSRVKAKLKIKIQSVLHTISHLDVGGGLRQWFRQVIILKVVMPRVRLLLVPIHLAV